MVDFQIGGKRKVFADVDVDFFQQSKGFEWMSESARFKLCVPATVRDIERLGSLEHFLHQETGVPPASALAYLPDGRRLTNGSLRELAAASTLFVFDKSYIERAPPVEGLEAETYLHAAHAHAEAVASVLAAVRAQAAALRVAGTALDLHVLALADTAAAVAANATRELARQAGLLAGLDADLALIGRVRVHPEFVSPSVRRAMERGGEGRTLGDYVSGVKMRQVAGTCARASEELRMRFEETEQAVRQLQEGADAVRTQIGGTTVLADAEACARRAQETLERIGVLEGAPVPDADADAVLQELRTHDAALRREVQLIVDLKAAVRGRANSTVGSGGVGGNSGFGHIQRLHGMLYAYGATVVEVVRRKEFARFFYARAQSILEVMAKLSASERKRRQVHRGEVHGQLPFETRGMDAPVPTLDFAFSAGGGAALLRVLDDLESASRAADDAIAVAAVCECRAALEKLVGKMDSLEAGFDRIAERSLLSASRLSMSRRRSTEADEQAFVELAQQLEEAREALGHEEAQHEEERRGLQAELHRLRDADAGAAGERERAERLERELAGLRAQVEAEREARRGAEERGALLVGDVGALRRELAGALADAAEQGRVADAAGQELAQVRADFEAVKALEARNAEKVAHLLEDQARNLRILEEARERGENLAGQIRAAREESESVERALREARGEKDRLLRAQAAEHERAIRDHRAEADGDRAVLERQFHELKAVQEHTERLLEDAKGEGARAVKDAGALREELRRVERELREARHAERVVREDLRAGRASQEDFDGRMEESGRLVAQILDVAMAFRAAHVKALNAAQLMASHPGAGRPSSGSALAESGFGSASMRHSVIGTTTFDEPSPIDPSDPHGALEALRAFDHDTFLEAITKTGATIRKWQKQCKEYRERAKGKISFRNFAKGDLALFLPTRNSVSKPWAAFNVSFPHYFLQATGHLAEQLKTREWIVARITSITERVVDHNDPTSNPYGLGDGVKYYMLEVEDWTQPSQQNKRKVSSRKVSKEQPPSPLVDSTSTLPPPGPPEAEVEDTFLTTHSPNLHLFPVRSRTSSSPPVRPSSLSRLLAQASPETQLDPIPDKAPSPSPPTSPPPPASPVHYTGSAPQHVPILSSPLRPASRASRISTTSRFSVGRIPALGSASSGSPGAGAGHKAPPTTALAEQLVLSSSPATSAEASNPFRSPSTPSPDESMSEGVASVLRHSRRRTSSYHVPRTSPLAPSSVSESTSTTTSTATARPTVTASNTLANLASSWGVSFGRKKKAEISTLASTSTATATATVGSEPEPGTGGGGEDRGQNRTGAGMGMERSQETSASELLKRF
ncbi:hypothetical protein B0H17DRAFT_1164119 [Mycena rosella]|uniref:Autophagy-related protein 11 n=1 Tax=Mycena rosella TaxID=1033263 RepID=A0AAD7FPC9_MYCRO|nr:hypothetical protein B0H17DRAFT_1164119 [Mycena rosella]